MPDAPLKFDQEMLDSVLNNPAIGALILDSTHKIVRTGKGLCDLLGYSENELVGKHLDFIVHPEERRSAKGSVSSLLGDEIECYSTERRYVHKDGSAVWIIASVSALPGHRAPGQPAIIAQITPIAKQKEAEAAAAEALERWSFALESAGQGVWDCDLEKSRWFFSAMWKRMRGMPEGEEIDGNDLSWLNRVHPDDRDLVIENIEKQNAGIKEYASYEYRERHRDGHWMWILARGRCVERKADGTPKRIIGTDTDITEIKQREMELSAMSQRLELALKTSQIGVWETDLETFEAVWDQRTFEIFGIRDGKNPLPPGAWDDMLHPEDRERALDICREGIAKRQEYAFDYRIVTPDKEVRHLRCRADFSRDSDGREKMVGVNWDISEDIELAEALRRANRLAEQRNRELEEARAEMEHASLHDPLTGLPNRRWLDDALAQYARVRKPSLTLLHLDLDRFKQINDTQGHAAGDAMLAHIGRLLRESVREEDHVARIGGDEFVILLSPSPPPQVLDQLVERIIARAREPMVWHGHECRSGVSVGIAEAHTQEEARQILVNADIALYRAKNNGRGCAAYFSEALQAEIVANKRCADEILKGLERGEFVPFYQPQIDALTLKPIGAEVLVRWRHPQHGLLTPDRFLKVAEDLNVVNILDRAMLEMALNDLARWDAMGLHLPRISVNLSARRLTERDLIGSLSALDFAPGRVSFELLESIFLDDRDEAIAFNIDAIKELGIEIDVDDFGTGYSSIVSLLQLKPHRLKIDRQLVRPIEHNIQQRQLLRSIIEIGKSQDIAVCAEGVESAAQVGILRDLGCSSLQGYYFAHPMQADDLTEFLRMHEKDLPQGQTG